MNITAILLQLKSYFPVIKSRKIEELQLEMLKALNEHRVTANKLTDSNKVLIDALRAKSEEQSKAIDHANALIVELQKEASLLEKGINTRDAMIKTSDVIISVQKARMEDMMAYLRTGAKFGGTLDQLRELLAKAVAKHEEVQEKVEDGETSQSV